MKVKKIFGITVLLFVGVLFTGCIKNNINFNRESKFEQYKRTHNIQDNQLTKKKEKQITKSKGMYIYKTNDSSDVKFDFNNVNFGPRDVNFAIQER